MTDFPPLFLAPRKGFVARRFDLLAKTNVKSILRDLWLLLGFYTLHMRGRNSLVLGTLCRMSGVLGLGGFPGTFLRCELPFLNVNPQILLSLKGMLNP